jgi:hypothetical protein
MAESVLEVEAGGFAGTSGFGNDDVWYFDLFAVETSTERFHAHPQVGIRSGLDPGDEVIVGEAGASGASFGAVLGRQDDSSDGEVVVVLGEGHVLADSWHSVSESIELSWESNISVFGNKWWESVLNQEPGKPDTLVKAIKILELACAETCNGSSITF